MNAHITRVSVILASANSRFSLSFLARGSTFIARGLCYAFPVGRSGAFSPALRRRGKGGCFLVFIGKNKCILSFFCSITS